MARGALNTVASLFLFGLVTACAQTGAPGQGDQPGPGATGTRGEGRAAIASAYPPPKLTANAQVAIADATRAAKRATAAAVGKSVPVQATNMVTYTNPTLGLSFAYPAALGEVEFDIGPGETGFEWHLGFSRFDALSLDGRSVNFSEGRGGMDEDSYGFVRAADGTYRWRNPVADSEQPIDVTEVLPTEGGEVVLFEVPQSGFQQPPDENYVGPPAALVNLAGEQFPGFIAILREPERLPMDTFRAILRTIRTAPPSAAWPDTSGEGFPTSRTSVASESEARSVVEELVPQAAGADEVIVRRATRGGLDRILGVIRHSGSPDTALWILAYRSTAGFTDLGRLDMGFGDMDRAPQPVAYFAIRPDTGRITSFGLMPDGGEMAKFAALPDSGGP